MNTELMMQEKIAHLNVLLLEIGRVAVAFSGGVDSTLLLQVAHNALGDNALALTAVSPSMPAEDRGGGCNAGPADRRSPLADRDR